MEMSPVAARVLSAMLEQRTGQQLAPNRQWRIDLALQQTMRDRNLPNLDAVAAQMAGGRDPELAEQVVEALLNNETSFFRDAGMIRMLTDQALIELAKARSATRRLRIWSAGCSTGQEAYSLAMAFADDERWAEWHIDIVASDVSHTAVGQARAGRYSQFEIQRGLPVRAMVKWFEGDDDHWRAVPCLRNRVRFHVHNLLEPPPLPGRFDAILCRNVLLYFTTETRRRVFDRLAEAIAPDGMLMLGAGETVIGHSERFVADTDHRGLYRSA